MKNTYVQLSSPSEVTVIPNTVIDHIVPEANELQLKVYLYILRHQADSDLLQISQMADFFNETEKEIVRALHFWEQKGILISVQEESAPKQEKTVPEQEGTSLRQEDTTLRQEISYGTSFTVPVRPRLSRDEVRKLSQDREFSELMFLSESFVGKPLTSRDVESLLFIKENLHFSSELSEYLLEYCASQNKKNFKYVEAVAVAWASQGITTPEEAKAQSQGYSKQIYSVMNALGKKSDPTPTETAYIQRWYHEYGMEADVIEEACRRTVLATDRNRFQYADKILHSWSQAGVRSLQDIAKADSAHAQKKTPALRRSAQPAYAANNPFLQHTQSDTDYESLEKLLQ
ncbi:MAG: DnaD domain protein [Lachnospiraceae bacterium]|nr:DnaD domain protein [Lachnospiraceae bacterium]